MGENGFAPGHPNGSGGDSSPDDSSWWDGLWEDIDDFWTDIGGAISDAIDSALGFLVSPLQAIGTGLRNMGQGISGAIDSLAEFFTGGLTALKNALLSPINYIKDKFTTLIDYLTPSSENFILKLAFVPDDDYFSDRFEIIKTNFVNKIGVDGTEINQLGEVTSQSLTGLSDFKGTVYGQEVEFLNFDWFTSYLPRIQNLARGFMFPLLLFYNLNQIYFLVRGVNLYGTGRKGGEKE